MRIFEKKWFRALLSLGICLAIIIVFALSVGFESFNDKYPDAGGSIQAGVIFGCLTAIGVFLYFIAFDLLGDKLSSFIGVIRIILMILGTLLILAFGLLSSLFALAGTSLAKVKSVSPWLFALSNLWMLGALTTFIVYYFIVDNVWNDALFPLVPLMCYAGSYIVCVIFTYIANAVGLFFCWVPLILAAGEIGFMIYWFKNEGLPFLTNEDMKEFERSMAAAAEEETPKKVKVKPKPVTHTEEPPKDTRREYASEKPIKRAIYDQIVTRGNSYISDYSVKWESPISYNVLVLVSITVTISGRLKYIVGLGNEPSFDQQRYASSEEEHVQSEIRSKVEEIVSDVKRNYKGYDTKRLIVNVDGIKIRFSEQ